VDSTPAFSADALTKIFGVTTALDHLTVEVPRGSVGLVGANGAGKTTLFRLMLGLIRPTSGGVQVCGRAVVEDPVGVRSRLGFMPEHDCLPPDQTAADLVATLGELSGLPARAARQRASDVLDLVGLDEARFRPIEGFSTGMRQRTKLAQALVADPELVLLDEPTAGLDPMGRDEMLALVARLDSFGISAVLATHLLDDVQSVCDHVVMIDGGRLVLAGPTEKLLERAGTVRVDVGGHTGDLVDRLGSRGLHVKVLDDTSLEVGAGVDARTTDQILDAVRDTIAELGLPLHSLSSRHASLDEVFLRTAVGAVYDRGYRPYDGLRRGRWASTLALYLASIRRALGIRRSWRQKVFPWVLLAIVTVPAIVNVGIGYVTRDTPADGFEFITYREYVGVSSALLLFVALTAPDVVCPDRRYRLLPLIFARPLVGREYVLAKVGAIATIVFGFSFLPQVVLFVGQMLVSDGALDYLRDNAEVLWKVPVSVTLLAVYYAAIGVAVASLTSRRIVGGVSMLALALVPSVVTGAVLANDADEKGPVAALNLLALPLHLRDVVFLGHIDPESPLGGVSGGGLMAAAVYVVVLAAAFILLFARYREPDA
jgi:ABC-2 type transport system ATP-binding protein